MNEKQKSPLDNFKGKVRYRQRKKDGKMGEWSTFSKNLYVDDGKELTLDFLFGFASWWNYKDESQYTGGDSGWNTTRYVAVGTSMFDNQSHERASGIEGIATGQEYNYQISQTYLVSPEDSFLSAEVGSRVVLNKTRRDQTVELRAVFDSPGDIPTGTEVRELGVFLKSSGPLHDPSLHNGSKDSAMICRSARYGTGYYNAAGATGQQGDPGFEPCYKDDPIVVTSDIEIEWIFGEQ